MTGKNTDQVWTAEMHETADELFENLNGSEKFPKEIDSSTKQLTKNLFEQYVDAHPGTNSQMRTILLASLSITLRQQNKYVTDDEISEAFNSVIESVSEDRSVFKFDVSWGMYPEPIRTTRNDMNEKLNLPLQITRPGDHAYRARESESIPNEIIDEAIDFIDETDTRIYSGCKPSCVLGGAIYIVGKSYDGTTVSQNDISEALGISTVSISNSRDRLKEHSNKGEI